jgi:hypothetical protein
MAGILPLGIFHRPPVRFRSADGMEWVPNLPLLE